jgi:hypothetical protein
MSDKKAAYMARFKTFTPAKKARHVTIVAAALIHLLGRKQAHSQIGGQR